MSKPDESSFSSNRPLVVALKRPDRREGERVVGHPDQEPLSPGDVAGSRRLVHPLGKPGTSPHAGRVVIKSGRRLVFLETSEIDWIEASGNYVNFHVGRESYIVRSGIGQIELKLNRVEFIRIHRSIIVNIGKIKELEPCDNGEYIVALKDGKQLSCSRGYGARLQQVVEDGYFL